MGKIWKNICQNLCRIIKEIPWQKIDFCNMFKKLNKSTEHDLEFLTLLKGNSFQNVTFFLKNPQKVIKDNIFNQKVRNLHFLCHLIWPRWFNFLVHDLSAYIWLDFPSVFHMLFVYSRKKKTMTKKWKEK